MDGKKIPLDSFQIAASALPSFISQKQLGNIFHTFYCNIYYICFIKD